MTYTHIAVIGSGTMGAGIATAAALAHCTVILHDIEQSYLDRALAYANVELRCDVIWRFSLIAGVDAGRVARTLTAMSTDAWIAAPVVGLRLDMDDFLVRADIAPGPESTGFYLNFGHVF